MTELKTDTKPKIQMVRWALLSEWWCAPIDADENEIAKLVAEMSQVGLVVKGNLELIKDRLYGGFKCEEADKRHIFFATGNYTYLGTNSAVEAADREQDWARLLENGNSNNFIGGGPFTQDAPPVPKPSAKSTKTQI